MGTTILAIGLSGLLSACGKDEKAAAPTASTTPPELIARKDLFGNPSRSGASISPDGTTIAFLAPRDGVMNIWVAPVGQIDAAKPLTADKERPIRRFFWAPDGSQILYLQDKGGNEDFLLYGVNVATAETKVLTPYERTTVEIVAISSQVPDAILIGMNNRDPKWHDVHRLDLKTGKLDLVMQNDGYGGFEADRSLTLRLASKPLPDGGLQIEPIGKDGKMGPPILTIAPDDVLTSGVTGIPLDGNIAYLQSTAGRDKSAIYALDLTTGATSLLAESDKADIGGALTNPTTGALEAYNVNYLKDEWIPVGDAVAADIAFLNEQAKGQWNVTSRSRDDNLWTIVIDRVTEPAAFWLYDRKAKSLTRLFTVRPNLEGKTLAPMQALEIPSRDGKILVSYLTLPPGTDANRDGKPEQPLPLVLNVHGGPWARDGYGYNGEHQWMANRGYAVLSVNFRGSTGFGKGFTNAGDKQWGRSMHDDLIDAVDWAIKNGITPKDKVAIYGGSYGGYATLWGMTNTPDRFACGVDIVGPSNLNTLLASVPPYWAAFYEQLARRVGDPRTEEGRALLTERSPLTYVDQITKPLLIAQGANDPRVKQAESDQIVTAMKAKNIPVTYVLYPDEGHGFARPANRTSFYAVAEGFLSHCLGGRQEPVGSDFDGASLQVLEGVDYVPGLKEALAAKK
ncbi:S9 family peptidase [Niveispirillum lacus]|uniref:S9 family peptidase n=1 Tax=Niveispirillum lacus TaxID=1981099 RepID=A0A255Z119_9PROT|nr:S9 family peptidase [Niveispirillum lacus]